MIAAENNKSPDIIRTLIELGLNVNEKGQEGHTALMIAAGYNKNPEIIKALIEAVADIELKDSKGKIALDYAKEKDDKEIIDILIEHGAK